MRQRGDTRVGLVFVAGEERGSEGAVAANRIASPQPVSHQRRAHGQPARRGHAGCLSRPAHDRGRGRPFGLSRRLAVRPSRPSSTCWSRCAPASWPDDSVLGRTHYTVGLIEGGVAPNVVPARASAEVLFRSVGPHDDLRAALAAAIARSRRSGRGARSAARSTRHTRRVRVRRVRLHDRHPAAVQLGHALCCSGPAPSTWPTPTGSTSASTSCLAAVDLTIAWPRRCWRRSDTGTWGLGSWVLGLENPRTSEPPECYTGSSFHHRTGRPHEAAGHSPVAGRTAARDLCNLRAANRVRAGRQQR